MRHWVAIALIVAGIVLWVNAPTIGGVMFILGFLIETAGYFVWPEKKKAKNRAENDDGGSSGS